jgi:hypothetical protein
MPFQEALDKLGSQTPIGAALSASEWSDLPLELRESAFFSANVESLRFLQEMQDSITDFIAGNTKTLPDGQTLLATGSRAAFVDQMQRKLAAAGIERTTGGLTDITSERRLGMIFDIKTQQASSFGYWKQGMNPDLLDEFPAARFIRIRDVKEPRLNHIRFENQVYLKTDPIWWLEINKDFGVPWKPFGWGCGHDIEDVDRDEAEKLRLIAPGQKLDTAPLKRFMNFNQNLQASAAGIEPELLEKMKQVFGDQIKIEGDSIAWTKRSLEPMPSQTPAPVASPDRQNPVSDALDLHVSGNLKDQVQIALDAIDEVHDDGNLPEIPLNRTTRRDRGYFQPQPSADGISAEYIAVRSDGSWPALTTVHEIGHFLDLEAIGQKGAYATRFDPAMKQVLAVAEKTDLIKALREIQAEGYDERIEYYLKPQEIWARAYAQFIAGRASSPLLKKQLAKAIEAKANRQWQPNDFEPMSEAIEKLLKSLGWL